MGGERKWRGEGPRERGGSDWQLVECLAADEKSGTHPFNRAHAKSPTLELCALRLLLAVIVLALVPRIVVPASSEQWVRVALTAIPPDNAELSQPRLPPCQIIYLQACTCSSALLDS